MLSEDFGAETTKRNCKGDYHLLTACGACKRCAEQRFQLTASGEVTGTTHGDIMRILRARLGERNTAQHTQLQLSVTRYCEEEVSRQGHDITAVDGIQRVGWMLDAWCYALNKELRTTVDIEALGMLIERDVNRNGFRTCGVRVGPSVIPGAPSTLHDRVSALLRTDAMEPLEFYRAFEEIHPFQDGNGRVGKILLNWRAGTLLKPFFPPNNFWGREIRNP